MVYDSVDSRKDKEEKILLFLSKTQGCNKQAVIDYAERESISTRVTTWNILEDLEERKIILLYKDRPNSRDYKIKLLKDNPITEIYFEIGQIKRIFNLLVDEIIKDTETATLHAFNTEYNIKVKTISLLYSILKLISSIINEILSYYLSKIIKDKNDLVKEYRYFYGKVVEIQVSFDRLKEILDETSLEYIPIFSKRNDTYFKTFLWSVMIFYETRKYPHYFLYSKKFKSNLFSLMRSIYNLGKMYVNSFYDEIVYDKSTYSNEFHGFPNARYTQPLKDELRKLDYIEFIRLLIERCFLIESFNSSSARQLLLEIEKNKINTVLEIDDLKPGIFENMIQNVVKSLYQNHPSIVYN